MKLAKLILFCALFAVASLQAIPWMFPETLLTRDDPATSVISKIDSNGDAIAIWVTKGGSEPQFSIYEAATQIWTPPNSLDRSADFRANQTIFPALCISEEGRAIAFWVRGRNLVARVRVGGIVSGKWEPPVEEEPFFISTETNGISEICADMNISGNAAVAWSETKLNPLRDVAMARRYIKGTWVPSLSEPPCSLYDDLYTDTVEVAPSVRINDAGDFVAVWKLNQTVVARRFSAQENIWAPPLSDLPFCLSAPRAFSPKVAIDTTGDFYATWIRDEKIEAIRMVDGMFYPVADLGGANGPPEIVALNGVAIAVWPSIGDMIYTSVFSKGTWSLSMMISQIGAAHPAVDIDASGNGIAVWENSATGTVQMADFYRGVWQTPVDLFPIGNDPRFATVTLSRSGNTLVSWKTNFGTGEVAICLKNPVTSPILPPPSSDGTEPPTLPVLDLPFIPMFGDPPSSPVSIAGRKMRNHFGLVSEIYHEVSWQPSPDPSVVGYQIFVYNKLVEQVPRTATFFRDHNKPRGATVPYQVRAINSDGVQSHPLTIILN